MGHPLRVEVEGADTRRALGNSKAKNDGKS